MANPKFRLSVIILVFLSVGCGRSEKSRNESNWDALDNYVHPNAEKAARLRLDELIEDSSNGLVFRMDLSLAELDRWYSSRFPVSIRDDFEPNSGRAGIYFETDGEYRDSAVFLFDTRIAEANDALAEMLTPKRIQSVAKEPCVVVVAFLDDPVEAARLAREFNKHNE